MKKTLLIIVIFLIPPAALAQIAPDSGFGFSQTGTAKTGAAQKSRKDVVPRIGVIKDVAKASKDIPEDCGNFLLFLKNQGLSDKYVFLAGPEGLDAWMNLDGRDTRLNLLKTTLWYRAIGKAFRHDYSAGKTRVTFSFEPTTKFIIPYPTKIVVRKGGASRTIMAFGYPQCD